MRIQQTELPSDAALEYLVRPANGELRVRALTPYSELACDFLQQLSTVLMADAGARDYPDVISFAYWCRKGNVGKLKASHAEGRQEIRLGLGLVFHIAPSNVPVNFAFSLAFGLLSGNANVVRVPSRAFAQTTIICAALRQLCARPEFAAIAAMTALVRYERNDAITGAFSSMCNGRIIWGGDQAINTICQQAIPERGIEIAFADRYSFCAIDGGAVLDASPDELAALARGFYNDVYLMDQNACSSPHLIVWLGDATHAAKERFWQAVHAETAGRFALQPVNAVDKYTMLCRSAIEFGNVTGVTRHDNYIYRLALDKLPADMNAFRGQYGLMYEFDTDHLDQVAHIVSTKYQTLTYFGLSREACLDFVLGNALSGVDRIVPIGQALDIGVIWDGYDIVRSLSRIIDFK
jgi:hypothetical protein